MMLTVPGQYEIRNGPSKFDLSVALFSDGKHAVDFTFLDNDNGGCKVKASIVVNGMELVPYHETRFMWKISGSIIISDMNIEFKDMKYNSKTRQGTITLAYQTTN